MRKMKFLRFFFKKQFVKIIKGYSFKKIIEKGRGDKRRRILE
jgi:hypothetical protein